MTAHQLARLLLDGPDLPVLIPVDDQGSGCSPAKEPGVEHCEPGEYEHWLWEWSDQGELEAVPVVTLSPESFS